MNGIHDMGGMDNFGPVSVDRNEPVFHEHWERRIFSIVLALLPLGKFNFDEIRRTVELIPPAEYLTKTYYERLLISIEKVLIEKNIVTAEELKTGEVALPSGDTIAVTPDMMVFAMTNPMLVNLDLDIPAKFKNGQTIVAKNMNPKHHTRIPRYVRGKKGKIEHDHGIFLLPDAIAHGGVKKPQHVYTVRFQSKELWGEDASSNDAVFIDLFDDYMDPVN